MVFSVRSLRYGDVIFSKVEFVEVERFYVFLENYCMNLHQNIFRV